MSKWMPMKYNQNIEKLMRTIRLDQTSSGIMSIWDWYSWYTWAQSFGQSGLFASPRWSPSPAEFHRGRPASFHFNSSIWFFLNLKKRPCTRGTPRVQCRQGQGRHKCKTQDPLPICTNCTIYKYVPICTLHQRNPQSPMLTRTRTTPMIDFQSPLGAST